LGLVYAARRQRTVDLVRASIKTLQTEGASISLASVAGASRRVDPQGKGVSESALLHNAQARACYEEHHTWVGGPHKRVVASARQLPAAMAVIKLDRDIGRARQRYLRLGKRELVERLLKAELACAQHEQHWLSTADELFAWMLLAGRLARPS